MALTRLPGFVIDSTSSFTFAQANVTGSLAASNISANANVDFTGSGNVSLGPVGNVKITGGTANYVLQTDGAGNLSWVAQSAGGGSNIANGNSNVNIATANSNITMSVSGNANIVTVTGTGVNVAGTLNVTGNANAGNLGVTGVYATTLGGTLTTAAQPNITSVGTLTDLNVSGNAVISGNLTVDGNLVYVNVTDLSVEDPIIQLQTGANGAAPSSNSGKDVGTALNYYDTSAKVAFMGWDVSNAEFGFGNAVSISSEVVTWTSYGNIRAGYFIGNGSQLTGITSAAYANYIANGNSNVNIATANGNVTVGVSGNANIVTVTGTGVNIAGTLNTTGNITAGNANLGNLTTSNYFAGTLTTAAQPNITSVGTLTSLTVTGNISSGNANLGNLITANYTTAVLTTGAQPNITSLGTLSNLTSNGTINFTNASNVSLGSVGNLHITGGTNGYVLSTDGSGTLSWVAQSGGGSNIANGTSNVNIATSGGNVTTSVGGNANILVVTGTGANINGTLAVTGTSNLGNVGNVKITGGNSNYILKTDGAGNLSWTSIGSGTVAVDSFTGNGVQTTFALSTTPGDINLTSVNYDGVILLKSDYTLSGANVTLSNAPANGSKLEVTTMIPVTGGGSTNAQDLLSPFLLMGA